MNIFYEESGQFKTAAIVQRNDATYQVDTAHGKRAKIKANNVFFEFDGNGADFLQAAQSAAEEIDTDLLWEVCGEEEFSGEAIAAEYFGHAPSKPELAATLIALYAAPMYFYKKAKGIFKAAPAETLKQALAAMARKQEQEAQMAAWAEELNAFRLPEAIARDLPRILHQPDKQSLTYKTFIRTADVLKLSPLALAQQCGGVPSIPQYLLDGFLLQHFPRGTDAPAIAVTLPENLPQADASVRAFSIDDASTSEVDDALSLHDLGNGKKRVGIHIAVPALAVANDSEIERNIFARQSTVYYPSGKITMLPENWISAFSLDEGAYRPCVSIYFEVDAEGGYGAPQQRIESVFIADNLRLQTIEPFFNRERGSQIGEAEQFPHHAALQWFYAWAISLQKKRNRYEENAAPRYDYSVDVDAHGTVSVLTRERDAPLDTLVSEMMILANSTWAKILDEHNIGGIFRVQPPQGKVRMSTQSEAHDGMGVAHYAWFTSPLRRAADYINQRQLLSLIDPQYSPRYSHNDVALFAALRDFDGAYAAYGEFQQQMERYWSLVYIQQNALTELTANVLRSDLVRVEGLPLVARSLGIPIDMPPKSRVKMRVGEIDLITQSVSLHYINAVAPSA
ncbi:MAG: RNB domain-containing ribonuclease [Neisseria sp.]|nr:RNB domain-containing ribonuclease [Neisseria sp.]